MQQSVLYLNGQQIEILDKLNEIGKIKLYSGILKYLEQNILIIEINLNFQHQDQLSLFVYDQVNYEYYKEKFQFTFLKTQNDCLFQLHQHKIYLWHEYFQQQEFKILPLQQKDQLFHKYCRQQIKQKTYDLCLYQQDNLGNIQLKGIDNRLFRDNDLIYQLDINTQLEYLKLDIQLVNNLGNLYFQILTDIDLQQLNQMTQDQRIHLISNSPLYDWQKQEIINFINPQFVEQITKQQLLNLLKEDHFNINQQQIIYQYLQQQQQIQSQLNYLYYHINKVENKNNLFQEYQYLNTLNSELYKFIKNNLIQQTYSIEIEDIIKQQLDELIRFYYQFNFNLKQTLYKNLILKHNKLQWKLDKLYQPTQFLGQFGTLQIILFTKLQHQNKMIIQNLEQQSNFKLFNDILSIFQFNQSLNKLKQLSKNIKIEFKTYQNELITQLMQIKSLLESNLRRIKKEFQSINFKYLMMVANQDESDQTQFVTTILERQQFLKNTISNKNNEIPDIIYKQNSHKVDILNTTQQYQESECIIRDLKQILEGQYEEVFQFEEKQNMRISNFVNELRQKIQKQLDELIHEFNSQFQSIKQFLINISKNQNLINNQQFIYNENRIQLIIQKQIQRFSIIQELLQQNQTKKQYYNQVSKKIEEERTIIQILVNSELKILNEILNKSQDIEKDDQQEQDILEFEFIILKKQYQNVTHQLEQEIQNIRQKFTSLEISFQEQLLLSRKIEILCQENKLVCFQTMNHAKYMKNSIDQILRKIQDKFEESKNRFYQFFIFLNDVKAKIYLQQDQDRLCLDIEQKLIEIQEYFQIIQNQNIKKSRDEKRIEYQKLRNKLEFIQKEIIIKGNQIDLNSQGYYQQLTLIILSKFYHLSRFHQRLMQSNVLNNNQQIQIEDLELINSQKEEYALLETQVDYYRKVVIENNGKAIQIENLSEKLEELEKQIEQKKNYLLQVIQFYIEQHLNQSLSSQKMIDQLYKFTNYLEFSKFLPIQLIQQVR